MTKSSFFVFLIVLLGVILLNTACEHIPFMSKEEAAMESGASRHSFDDILVPAGLEVDEKASFISRPEISRPAPWSCPDTLK